MPPGVNEYRAPPGVISAFYVLRTLYFSSVLKTNYFQKHYFYAASTYKAIVREKLHVKNTSKTFPVKVISE